jgi:hypothetical protein
VPDCGLASGRRLTPDFLDCHCADFFFDFDRVEHDDGIPGAAVKEAAVWAFAQAFLAADAENGIDLDAPERGIVFVRHPEHAIFDRTVLDACGRARASCAAFGDDRQFFRLLLARGGQAFRLRFKLQFVRNHPDSLSRTGCRRHMRGIIGSACPK